MEKIIKIGEKEILFRSTAGTPIIYRNAFHKDMLLDLNELQNNFITSETDEFGNLDTNILFQLAYAMSGAYQNKISYIDWLDQFELFDMVDALFEILDMWTSSAENVETGLSPKNLVAMETEN